MDIEGLLNWMGNTPGIVGSLVVDNEGRIPGKMLPEECQGTRVEEAGLVLSDLEIGLSELVGNIKSADFRCQNRRVFAQRVPGASRFTMLVICGKGHQHSSVIEIVTSVGARKLGVLCNAWEVEALTARADAASVAARATEPVVSEPLKKVVETRPAGNTTEGHVAEDRAEITEDDELHESMPECYYCP